MIKDVRQGYLMDIQYENMKRLNEFGDEVWESKMYKIMWDDKEKRYFYYHEDQAHRHYPYGLILKDDKSDNVTELPQKAKKKIVSRKLIKKYHPILRKEAYFEKFSFTEPEAVSAFIKDDEGGHENHIRYTVRWGIDKDVHYGMPYTCYSKGLEVIPTWDITEIKKVNEAMGYTNIDPTIYGSLTPLFFTPLPDIPYVGVDIECLTRGPVRPDPDYALEPVTSIAFSFSEPQPKFNNATKIVLALDNNIRGVGKGKPSKLFIKKIATRDAFLEFLDSERKLLKRFIEILDNCHAGIILTFNGDEFDFRYLYKRMSMFNFRNIPFRLRGKKGSDKSRIDYEPKTVDGKLDIDKYKIHIDLYKFFKHPFIKNYAFSGKYKQNSLNAITDALLGLKKIDHEATLNDLPLFELIEYNVWDADLTRMLWEFDERAVQYLMFFLMRLGYETLPEVHRYAITDKISNFMLWDVSRRNMVMFRRDDLPKVDAAVKSTTGKKFRGALNIDPVPGIHWNVECHDVLGMYTNVAHRRNVCPTTMNCPHEGCKINKVPEVGHHICREVVGVASEMIGFFTNLRALYFKPKKKEKRLYGIIEQTLKVIGNSSYGWLCAEFANFFSIPSAEAVTAYGRSSLARIRAKAISLGMQVIYGDTDSLFLMGCTAEKIAELYKFAKDELDLELDLEKSGEFMLLTDRAKNYLLMQGQDVDIKGLKLKKSNVPTIVRETAYNVIEIIKSMKTADDIPKTKMAIELYVRKSIKKIFTYQGDVSDYAFYTQVTKPISSYKSKVQHVWAAKLEAKKILEQLPPEVARNINPDDLVPVGKIQGYIKCKSTGTNGSTSLPLNMATPKDIDANKYIKELTSTLAQLIEPFKIDTINLTTRRRKKSMNEFI